MIQLLWQNQFVALKSPEFGDSLGLRLNTTVRRAMDMTPYSFVSPDANKVRNFSFKNMSRLQSRNFFVFMRASRGKDILLIDHDGQQWRGSILTSPMSITHSGINDVQLSFNFEGVRIE